MKNIERYKNTGDALKAWEEYAERLYGTEEEYLDFDKWLVDEYAEPHVPTLLEAAKKAVDAYGLDPDCQLTDECMDRLSDAIAREKQKPLRNCDRYRTANEAFNAYVGYCSQTSCRKCQYKKSATDQSVWCSFSWLYAEAEKEAKR